MPIETRHPCGSCPRCGTMIPRHCLLIEYEKDGEESAFADCPECRDVVRPQ